MKQFAAPDLHAPRNRDTPKDVLSYPAKDPHGFFCRLKEQHPQLQKYSNKQIADWIAEYNKQLATDVATNRDGVKLPEGLGAVVTGLSKPPERTTSYNTDYNTSITRCAAVTHRNGHTNGYLAKIYYINNIPRCRFTNHKLWSFKPVRAFSRAVATIMKSDAGYKNYIVFTKTFSVSSLFDKNSMKKTTNRRVREQETRNRWVAEYDEFRF
jgi:hypothetical protein